MRKNAIRKKKDYHLRTIRRLDITTSVVCLAVPFFVARRYSSYSLIPMMSLGMRPTQLKLCLHFAIVSGVVNPLLAGSNTHPTTGGGRVWV